MNEFKILHELSSHTLRDLAALLSTDNASGGISPHRVQQLVGSDCSSSVSESIAKLLRDGWSMTQLAALLLNIGLARGISAEPEDTLDIVLSGPEVPGVPTRDTAAVMNSMVAIAEQEILLVGYAVYNGKKLFEPIARRWDTQPDLQVRFILNIARGLRDTSLDSEIVGRFLQDFSKKHWPWDRKPEIYYDPRALATDSSQRASLHAKCVIVDRKIAFVTSANFTDAAQTKNVEAGVVVSHQPFADRMALYFQGLTQTILKKAL